MVGVPAAARRALRDTEVATVRDNAATYIALAQQHRDALDQMQEQP